jgi:hypothetical protein
MELEDGCCKGPSVREMDGRKARIKQLIRTDSEWTEETKENALDLMGFYAGNSGSDCCLQLCAVVGGMCLIMGIILIALSVGSEQVIALAVSGAGCAVLAVVAWVGARACCKCRDREKEQLENELGNGGQGPVINQTLVQENL